LTWIKTAARAGTDARGARQAAALVLQQRAGNVVLPPRQHGREGPGVLNALAPIARSE
jgi:hypothetical protein